MAQGNWAFLDGGLSPDQIDNGITAGSDKPNNGGNFVYGFNSLQNVDGVVALHTAQVNFAPLIEGGSIRAAIKRGLSGGNTGFTPFLFIGMGGSDVSEVGYLLGLSDGDPYHISLRKGAPTGGIPDSGVDPDGTNNILLRSAAAFSNDIWHHLRLDMIVQGSGDVLLQVFESDLNANTVQAPVWTTIAGMEGPQAPTLEGFVDDSLGINTNSSPLIGGFTGFGFQSAEVTRRGFFDQIEVSRQL